MTQCAIRARIANSGIRYWTSANNDLTRPQDICDTLKAPMAARRPHTAKYTAAPVLVRLLPETRDQLTGFATKCYSSPSAIARGAIEIGLPIMIQRLYNRADHDGSDTPQEEKCRRAGSSQPTARRVEASHESHYHEC